jgi:hypothetical protein
MPDNNDQDKPIPTPYLVIPYFGNDKGSRPLPVETGIPPWHCSSIYINGVPYTGQPLSSGNEVQLSVVVNNRGALSAAVTVRIFWANPTTGFTASNVNLIDQVVYLIPRTTTLESPVMKWTPGPSMPQHICLIAEATCLLDPSSGAFNVVYDRHYAQQNVNILLVHPGGQASFDFYVSNPEEEEREFFVRIRPSDDQILGELEKLYRAKGIFIAPEGLSLQVVNPGTWPPIDQEIVQIKLQPLEQQLCQAILNVPDALQPDEFVSVEIEQILTVEDQEKKIGSIGVIAFGHLT